MPDLKTEYLGLSLPHPFIVGASPLADTVDGVKRLEDAGAAAVVMRSLYEEQLRSESMATSESFYGHADSFGEALSYLPEPEEFVLGPERYLEHIRQVKAAVSVPIIASLNGTGLGPWLEHASLVEQAGADAIELNLYDIVANPAVAAEEIETTAVEIVREVRLRTQIPIAVKLSPFYTSLPNLASHMRQAGAGAFVLFNRFFEPDLDIEELEVTPRLALSLPGELLLRLRWLAILSGTVESDLAVSGGVHHATDAVKAIMCGASAVQVVSELLHNGVPRLTQLRAELDAWLEEHEYASVEQMRGSMDIARCPNPGAHLRAQYVRLLQTWSSQL